MNYTPSRYRGTQSHTEIWIYLSWKFLLGHQLYFFWINLFRSVFSRYCAGSSIYQRIGPSCVYAGEPVISSYKRKYHKTPFSKEWSFNVVDCERWTNRLNATWRSSYNSQLNLLLSLRTGLMRKLMGNNNNSYSMNGALSQRWWGILILAEELISVLGNTGMSLGVNKCNICRMRCCYWWSSVSRCFSPFISLAEFNISNALVNTVLTPCWCDRGMLE